MNTPLRHDASQMERRARFDEFKRHFFMGRDPKYFIHDMAGWDMGAGVETDPAAMQKKLQTDVGDLVHLWDMNDRAAMFGDRLNGHAENADLLPVLTKKSLEAIRAWRGAAKNPSFMAQLGGTIDDHLQPLLEKPQITHLVQLGFTQAAAPFKRALQPGYYRRPNSGGAAQAVPRRSLGERHWLFRRRYGYSGEHRSPR